MAKREISSNIDSRLARGNYIYYAQIMPKIGIYEVLDLKIHNVCPDFGYFTGIDMKGSKQTYLFNLDRIDKDVYFDREVALNIVMVAQEKNDDIVVRHHKYVEDDE